MDYLKISLEQQYREQGNITLIAREMDSNGRVIGREWKETYSNESFPWPLWGLRATKRRLIRKIHILTNRNVRVTSVLMQDEE